MNGKVLSCLVALFVMFAAIVVSVDCLYFNPRDHRLSPYTADSVLGWAPRQDFSRNFPQKDAAGNKYDALFALDHQRFRAYGNPASQNTKILFVGDSFTGDPFTGNKEMYFSIVKSALAEKYHKNVEVFAIGGGGYGTLQEYLMVKEQIHIIKPDIFVLQFSDNDFMNNLLEWEQQGIVRNQTFYRPYYSVKTGKIVHSPSPLAGIYRFLYNNSYFFRRVDIIIQRLQFKYYGDYSRKLSADEAKKFETDSYLVTKSTLSLLKKEFSKDAQLFFMIDQTDDSRVNDLQVSLARETGFTPLFFPMQHLNRFEKEHKGAVLRHADGGHLNILGNRILGEGLAEDLSNRLKKP
jgi:lysophospholipase L1-like esterase